ncbi:MAG: hypothetical protein O3A84_02700 [Proteobacteria bacterium]|nr:hypothetical protein [Pseudomonadota bacterium]
MPKITIVLPTLLMLSALIQTPAIALESMTVLRGTTAETIKTAREDVLPTILRGKINLAQATPEPSGRPAANIAVRPSIAAGNVLWYFSDDGRRLTACYLRGTGYVGQRRIVCTRNR